MPRSAAIPLDQPSGPPAPAPAAAAAPPSASGRAGAIPLGQAPAPPAATGAAPPPVTDDIPAAFNQGPDTLGQMGAFDPRAANSPWKDFMLAHLASAGQGLGQIGQTADDYVRAATNTFGLGDKLASAMGGTSLADEQAKTAAATQRLGPVAYAANMTGFGPVGKLGMATGIAADLAPAGSGVIRGALANATGSAAEGASANYLAALGHGASPDDAATSGLYGAAFGAPIGAVSEPLGRAFAGKGPSPPEVGSPQTSTSPATGMYAKKVQGYAPLDSVYFDSPTVRNAIDQSHSAISAVRDPNGFGANLGIPGDVSSTVKDLYNQPVATGRNLQEASRNLRMTGDWTGHRYADALDNVMANAQPRMTPGGQAPPGVTIPSTGQGTITSGDQSLAYNNGQVVASGPRPGLAGDAKQEGDLWHGRIQDLERLEPPEGADVPTKAAISKTMDRNAPQSGQQPTPAYQSLQALQDAMKPSFNWWHLRHPLGALLGGGIGYAEDQFSPEGHHNPLLSAGVGAAEGAAIFSGLPWLAQARPQGALNAARYSIGTGQPYVQPSNAPPVGDALRALILGNVAGSR